MQTFRIISRKVCSWKVSRFKLALHFLVVFQLPASLFTAGLALCGPLLLEMCFCQMEKKRVNKSLIVFILGCTRPLCEDGLVALYFTDLSDLSDII